MPAKVDLYDNAYANVERELYCQIRIETYGHDFGQTSWVSTHESERIPELLNLTPNSTVLEIGSGSGLYALHLAKQIGCRITGLDVNANGIASASQLAAAARLEHLAHFQQCDVAQPLPFAHTMFEAVFANDVFCHIPGRGSLLKDIFRILRPGGRLLFSDALIIGGLISHEEIATRSSIGHYCFSPPGENQRLVVAAGFRVLSTEDTSDEAAAIAQRWHDARELRRGQLTEFEGSGRFDGLQRFLSCVHTLTSEHRLLRHLYLAEKPDA